MKDTQDKRFQDILARHDIPKPPGNVMYMLRYVMGRDDWYADTDEGWFWFNRGSREWKLCPTGPMDF